MAGKLYLTGISGLISEFLTGINMLAVDGDIAVDAEIKSFAEPFQPWANEPEIIAIIRVIEIAKHICAQDSSARAQPTLT